LENIYDPVFQGWFHYVGGHPDQPLSPASLTSRVTLIQEGLAYEQKGFFGSEWECLFVLPLDHIVDARTAVNGKASLEWYGEDYFVDVDLETRGRKYTVRFEAFGMTQQKDATRLCTAIKAMPAENIPHYGQALGTLPAPLAR
jgi:hypothetical protein